MAKSEVERCIWDVHRGGNRESFNDARESFLDRYELVPEERQALLENDYGALYRKGIHPMAVLFFSQINGTPMPEYLRAIGASDQRVQEFSTLMQPRS